MMSGELIASSERRMILGLGRTGRSVARWWRSQGLSFIAADSRPSMQTDPTVVAAVGAGTSCYFGALDLALADDLTELVVSPGVSLDHPLVVRAKERGVRVIGDIDLFMAEAQAPVIGITGSNGKSTVTAMVAAIVEASGRSVAVGGNYGTPALDLLAMAPDMYVLELSSFQLERSEPLGLQVATVLNLSADHLDRHKTMAKYHHAKHRIFRGAKTVVVNRADPLTIPLLEAQIPVECWRPSEPDLHELGVREDAGRPSICLGFEPLIAVDELPLVGSHNVNNALAALAISKAVGLPVDAAAQALRSFRGLPHRCERVLDAQGVRWINDSKGTNVGATEAALKGLGQRQNIILIAGGVGKGQDFSTLREAAASHCRRVLTLGASARDIELALGNVVPTQRVNDLASAVGRAHQLAQPGDVILLSPGCASFDMFQDYEDRGDQFRALVHAQTAEPEQVV